MTYYFLLLNLFLILIPLFLAIDRKVYDFGNIKSSILPALVTTIIFSEIDIFFAGLKIITFNPKFLLGVFYRQLPLEEYLFIFAFSFAGLSIYNYLNAKYPKQELQKYSLAISNLMLGICIAMLFFAYNKWYTAFTFSVLAVIVVGIEYINQLRFMYRFYRAFVVCLIPFYICYGLICNLPIIQYKAAENVGYSLAKIPFENHFLFMSMLLLGVYILEFLKNRKAN